MQICSYTAVKANHFRIVILQRVHCWPLIMTITAVLTDETVSGEVFHTSRLQSEVEEVTLRDLIRLRIQQEAARFNLQRPVCFQCLVYPTGCEEITQGFRLPQHRDIDWEKQYAEALHAFEHHTLSIYVNQMPVKTLDEIVQLGDMPTVTFVRLFNLVAG